MDGRVSGSDVAGGAAEVAGGVEVAVGDADGTMALDVGVGRGTAPPTHPETARVSAIAGISRSRRIMT